MQWLVSFCIAAAASPLFFALRLKDDGPDADRLCQPLLRGGGPYLRVPSPAPTFNGSFPVSGRIFWKQLTCWEVVEPVQHRPPLPEAIYPAIISLAIGRKWWRWAAVTAAFVGVARPGGNLCRLRGRTLSSLVIFSLLMLM